MIELSESIIRVGSQQSDDVRLGSLSLWNPKYLFTNNELGAWYKSQDLRSLHQSLVSPGSVTAFGQTVAIRLDAKEDYVTGPELVQFGESFVDLSGWSAITSNASLSIVDGRIRVTSVAAGPFGAQTTLTEVVGPEKMCLVNIRLNVLGLPTSSLFWGMGGGPTYNKRTSGGGPVMRGGGTNTFRCNASPGAAAAGEYFEIEFVSAKIIAGCHADQSSDSLRPTLTSDQVVHFDGVNDVLNARFPSVLGADCTIARATTTGPSILSGQNITATYVDSTDSIETIILNRGLTPIETVRLTAYLEQVQAADKTTFKYPSNRITTFGDSLSSTIEGIAGAGIYARANTLVAGSGGQGAADIAIRQGGLAPEITVVGDVIPATGPVTVTVIAPATGYRVNFAASFSGTLAGIPGSLSRDASNVWTFWRTAGGSETPCPAGSRFYSTSGIASQFDPQVLWYGRNNVNTATFEQDVLDMYALSVAFLKPRRKKFAIVSITNATNEPSGSSAYNKIISFNNSLSTIYGGNYFDLRREFIDRGLSLAGITPTTEDLEAIAQDKPPPSLMADEVHPTTIGYNVQRLLAAEFINSKNWFI